MSECSLCSKSLVSYYEKTNSKNILINGNDYLLCPNCAMKYQSEDEILEALQNQNRTKELIEQEEDLIIKDKERFENMIMTTTPTIQYQNIIEYKGIVGAQVMAGINMFKDSFAAFRNTWGGRSKSLQKSMAKMRTQALDELKEEAYSLGADAVVGIKIDFDEYSEGMLMLSISGTAVITEKQ